MAINPNDWPIDPYTVDGVELAARLNAVIPSEFNALSTGKANLQGGNTFTGNQNFGGSAAARIMGDFSNAAATQRTLVMTNVANTQTHFSIAPNGTGSNSAIIVHNSSDASNSLRAYLQITPTAAVLGLDGVGSQAGQLPAFQIIQGGAVRFILDAGSGATRLQSANGNLVQVATATGGTRQQYIDGSNNLVFNNANGVGTFTMNHNGEAASHSAFRFSFGTVGGGGAIYRSQDGSGIRSCNIEDPTVGTRVQLSYFPSTGASFNPGTDGGLFLGLGILRWAQIYSTSGVISTSDAREKSPVRQMNDNEIACAEELSDLIGFYQWLKDIDKDGAEARWQVGSTAQKMDEVFKKYNLNSQAYGIILYEEYDAMPAEMDDEGNIRRPAMEAQDRWSANYAQLNQFMIFGLRSKQKKLEARLAALEAK